MIVFSNGMLRSGSTLQYNIAACVLETAVPLERAGFLGDFAKPEVRARLDTLKAKEGWTILKTHEAPLERSFYDERVRVLFSYRDVRDIAASIRKKWGYPFEQILSDIDAMIEIERQFTAIPNVLVQRYDTLYNDLPAATRDIAAFLGVFLDEADVARIAAENSVQRQALVPGQNEGVLARALAWLGRKPYDRKTLLHPDHISASGGRDGDWKNHFTIAEIETLNNHFSCWLSAHNYAEA